MPRRQDRNTLATETLHAKEDPVLETRGFNQIDLGTKDMDATRAFYQDVLGLARP